MPITTTWYNVEQTILHNQFTGHWTYEDAADLLDRLYVMTHELPYKVVSINEIEVGSQNPRMELGRFRKLITHGTIRDNTIRAHYFVNVTATGKALMDAIYTLFPRFFKRVRLFGSLEEALEAAHILLSDAPTITR